jgi:hypothetical protein
MWRARALALPALMVLVVACGGTASSQSSAGSETSNDPASSAAASTGGEASAAASTGGGGGDVESVAEALIPPNSTEVSNTTAEGISFVIYESTDSIESLQSHYEGAIPAAGMQIISTSEAGGNVSIVFAEDEGSTFGGAVSIFPSSSGSGGSGVQVTVGDAN